MTDLTIRRNVENDLAPLARLLADPDALTLVNPNAKQPFDPAEWQEKWLGEMDDESFYLVDDDGTEVGLCCKGCVVAWNDMPAEKKQAYIASQK